MSEHTKNFQPFYFSLEPNGNIAVVRFKHPRLSEEDNVEQLGFELMHIVDQLGYNQIILSMKGVEWITSSIIGKLIHLHRHIQRIKGALILCDLAPGVVDVLETSKLHTYFCIQPGLDESISQFQSEK